MLLKVALKSFSLTSFLVRQKPEAERSYFVFNDNMATTTLFPSSSLLFLFTLTFILTTTFFLRRKQPKNNHKHPPGPHGYPVIGNLHMLGTVPHRTLEALSKKHGPIMSLRLGQVPTIIVSSSSAAEQFLKTHDAVFSSRPKLEATHYLSYGSKGLVFSEYGRYWRNMRKVCTLQLLSASKVESFAPLRKRELEVTLKSLKKAASLGEIVDVSEAVHNVIMEIVYKMVLGCSVDEEFDLKGQIQQGMELSGAFNLADYVPFLGGFDLQVCDSKRIIRPNLIEAKNKIEFHKSLSAQLYD